MADGTNNTGISLGRSVVSFTPETVQEFTVQPSTVDVGHTTTLLATSVGGAGGVLVRYSGLPSGCLTGNSLELNCTPREAGLFRITITVTDSLENSANSSVSLTVNPGLSVHASLSVLPAVDTGYPVNGTALGSGGSPPYSFDWSFGDGNQTTGVLVSHAYQTPGVYAISVTVEDSTGITNSTSVAVTVVPRPEVVVVVAPGHETDLDVPVNLTAVVTGGVGVSSELWTFGDGTQSTGASVTHTWTRVGNYSVSLTFTDRLGVSDNFTAPISVHPALAGTFKAGNVSAAAPANPGSPVDFTSNISGGTSPYEVTWDFGDGSFATGLSASHSYATAGNYTVGIALVDAVGARLSTNITVVVASIAASSGGITSSGDNFGSGLFLGLVLGGAAAAVVLYIAAPRRGERAPAKPVSPYVPP
jgi:PKD repeat protein